MGAGKSTFLKKMQPNKLGYDCIDLDHALANDFGIHPDRLGEWILQNGFPLFRDKEKTKLKKLIRHDNSLVIALGGGSLNPEIFSMIEKTSDCYLVFLDTSIEVCIERIRGEKNRPLSNISESELFALYESRAQDYEKADIRLNEQEIKEIEGLEALVHNLLGS